MDDVPPTKPYRPRKPRWETEPEGEIVYERRDLERKRESSRRSMQRLRAERKRRAAAQAGATEGGEAASVVDGNNKSEYGEPES